MSVLHYVALWRHQSQAIRENVKGEAAYDQRRLHSRLVGFVNQEKSVILIRYTSGSYLIFQSMIIHAFRIQDRKNL